MKLTVFLLLFPAIASAQERLPFVYAGAAEVRDEIVVTAPEWSPFSPSCLDFSKPFEYAAKDTIVNWYDEVFFNGFEERERKLIKYVEDNHLSAGPFLCETIALNEDSTVRMCDPWVLAVFVKDGKYYMIPERRSFFSTLNHMALLKMNLHLDTYDKYFHIPIPYASKYAKLDKNTQLALSFYYFYDYQVNDNCSSHECQERERTKRKLTLNYTEKPEADGTVTWNYSDYTWIHRALMRGCSYNSAPAPCISAREITYTVKQKEPAVWRNGVSFEKSIGRSWQGSPYWQVLEEQWAPGVKNFSELGIP